MNQLAWPKISWDWDWNPLQTLPFYDFLGAVHILRNTFWGHGRPPLPMYFLHLHITQGVVHQNLFLILFSNIKRSLQSWYWKLKFKLNIECEISYLSRIKLFVVKSSICVYFACTSKVDKFIVYGCFSQIILQYIL